MKTEISILQTLGYFDIFQYPLTAEEIHLFLSQSVQIDSVRESTSLLLSEKKIFCFNSFYSLKNDPELVIRRQLGNQRATHLLKIAFRIGYMLQKFPFVKGIGISGSLSKNYADEDADIDFFIITQANRLWIARTLLHLFKKISFLAGKEHWYCMNYFIDEEAMQIAEKNIFTATEVVTLKPVCGAECFQKFYSANNWVSEFLPNARHQSFVNEKNIQRPLLKKIVEKLFNNRFGIWLDGYLMKVTQTRWMKKETNHEQNMKGEPIGLKISKHYARPNPEHLQKKIMRMLMEKNKKIETELGISFN